ncbi:MAG: hypothetical protein ACK2TV_13775 [Anaerolineales bacterium]
MKKKKFSVVSIIFFVLAGLLLAFSVWAAIYSTNYISSLIEAGQIVVEGNEFELVNFHMSSYGQYVIFALIFFGLGWVFYSLPQKLEEDFEFEDELDQDEELVMVVEEELEVEPELDEEADDLQEV